jgi:hypothetical protein
MCSASEEGISVVCLKMWSQFILGSILTLKLMLLYEVQLYMIEEVFNLFDTDGQQQLDEDELASAIFALGFSQNGHFEVEAKIFVLVGLQC